jgi:hypothetical protein
VKCKKQNKKLSEFKLVEWKRYQKSIRQTEKLYLLLTGSDINLAQSCNKLKAGDDTYICAGEFGLHNK